MYGYTSLDLRGEKETDSVPAFQLNIPTNPPLWTKPAAALASPDEDINMSRYCTSNFPDWEVSPFLLFPQPQPSIPEKSY